MATTGRYTYCPLAGKMHRNRRSFREWLKKRRTRRETPDIYGVGAYYPAYYPAGYKK